MSKALVLFLLLCGASPVVAQRDSVSRGSHTLRQVEVVADGERTLAAAVPVQTMSSEKMLRLGIQTLADALTHVAGITVRDYGGAGGMKTVSVRGIGSRHTAVIYDGLALSDCQTGEIDLSRYSLDNVASLQMVIGDGENIFVPARTNAAAAYLSIRNLEPTDSDHRPDVKGRLAYGAWHTVVPSIYVGQRIGRHLSYTVQGEFTHSDNDYPFKLYNLKRVTREHRVNSRMNSGHAEAGLHWQLSAAQSLRMKVYYYDNDRRLPGIVHLYTHENDERLHERNAFGQLSYRATLSEHWALQAHAKMNWAESDYRNHTPGSTVGDARYVQREWYATSSVLYAPQPWLAVDYSLDYYFNNLSSDQRFYRGPSRHSLLQSLAAKVKLKRLTVTGRLLQSNYMNAIREGDRGPNAHRLSPSLSLSYQLLPERELYLRAFYKHIFRMPTFNELYYYHIGSTVLRPETTSQLNVGLTGKLRTGRLRWLFTLDGYANRVRDKIIAIPFNMFVWQMSNLGKVSTFGLDFTATATLHLGERQQLEWTGNYSLQRAENRINPQSELYKNQIAYTPTHTFSASLSWTNPWVNVSGTIDGMDERWTTTAHSAGTRLAGFAELHLSAWRAFQLRGCRLVARASWMNVTGKQYELVANYPMPRSSWRVGVAVEL